jgi:hypothetical protein
VIIAEFKKARAFAATVSSTYIPPRMELKISFAMFTEANFGELKGSVGIMAKTFSAVR